MGYKDQAGAPADQPRRPATGLCAPQGARSLFSQTLVVVERAAEGGQRHRRRSLARRLGRRCSGSTRKAGLTAAVQATT